MQPSLCHTVCLYMHLPSLSNPLELYFLSSEFLSFPQTASYFPYILIRIEGLCDNANSIMSFTLHCLAFFVCDSPPSTRLGGILDPFHRWEVMIVFFHRDYPRHI